MCDPVLQAKRFAGIHIDAETDMLSATFITGFATVFGTAEGIRAAQAKSRREEHRSRKNNLLVHVPKSSQFSPLLEGRHVVLSGGRLFVDTGTAHGQPFGHPFEGYYLPYPDARFSGLVSSITHEAPIMNWIFVDRDTYQIRFGNRLAAEGNLTGPWDCTRQDRRLVLGGWEGFCAVYENGLWGLYFDVDGDRLKSKLGGDTRVVIDVVLERRELRTMRAKAAPAPTMGKAEAGEPGHVPRSRENESTRQSGSTEDPSGTATAHVPARESSECQLDGVREEYTSACGDDETRSEPTFSGMTYTGEERATDSDTTRADEDDGIRVCPAPLDKSGEPLSGVCEEQSTNSDRGWTSSVCSEESRPRYSSSYQPLEAEVDELREDVD